MKQNQITVAIAGNPNSGKTSIFNALTGAHQHVGNYPGVTVEKKEGSFVHNGVRIEVVDLPGTYGLEATSLDEKVARDFVIHEHPDIIVDVVDSCNFERSLYLTSQFVELDVKLVLALNMSDMAHASGQMLDLKMIGERLNCEVVETVGSKETGIDELKEAIIAAMSREKKEIRFDYGEEFGEAIEEVLAAIKSSGKDRMLPHTDHWIAVKLLEGDIEADALIRELHSGNSERILKLVGEIRKKIEGHHGDTLSVLMAERRYGFAAGLYREVLRKEPSERRKTSDKIDDFITNRIIGIPIFLSLMYAVFYMTFKLGEFPMRAIEDGVGFLSHTVSVHWHGPEALKSLIVDGVINGVGGVLVFLPTIVILFLGIALMEDTGYMARAAFIMDRLMHKIGLHGKSFIPMIIGFGCSVPAIMATRTLEHRRDRLATMMVIPLMSCGARLTIYSLIIPAFFPDAWRAKVLWAVYVVGILLAIGIVKLLRTTVLAGESTPFVMELPPYRMPTIKGVLIHMWERAKLYLRKAATIILAISIVMWALTSYPKLKHYEIDRAVEAGTMLTESEINTARAAEALSYSVAGRIGKAIEPAMKPLGFDWKISTALIGAFAAKEVFVSQLGIVFSIGEADEESFSLREELRKNYSPLVGLCVMIFALIATPCMATVAIMRRESGRWFYAIAQFAGLTALAYVVTLLVFQIGRLII